MSRRLSKRATRDDDPMAVFVRGATVGAFVGAVIAGSTIWGRLRRRAPRAAATTRRRPSETVPSAEAEVRPRT